MSPPAVETPTTAIKRDASSPAVPEPPAKRATPAVPSLQVVLKDPGATAPKRGSALAAGFDLTSCEEATIEPKGRKVVRTGLQVSIPEGCYGRVAPRSGLAVKHFIDVGAGVVDADYRGELGVVLFNFGDKPFEVNKGDRIAQLVIEKIWTGDLEVVQNLEETERGAGGFGSTGVSKKL